MLIRRCVADGQLIRGFLQIIKIIRSAENAAPGQIAQRLQRRHAGKIAFSYRIA
jgi:hypothetical protein